MILIIIVSCSDSKLNITESVKPLEEMQIPFYIKSVIWDENEIYKNSESWEKYIEDTFDINIKIEQIARNPMEPFNYLNIINSSGEEGLVYFDNPMMFYQFVKNGALMSLDDYPLPSYIDNSYKTISSNFYEYNNRRYGIPIENGLLESSRIYYTQWFGDKMVSDINTIGEFYENMFEITFNDPDNNKLDDTPGLEINIWKINEELPDISKAFGCYFPYESSYSISYNPLTSSFEDTVFSKDFIEYMTFLKSMAEKRILVTDALDKGEVLASDNPNINPYIRFRKPLATFWGKIYNYTNSEEYSIGSLYLEGNNTELLHELRGYYGFKCYGILSGTKNPAEYIKLVDEVFSSDDRYYLALMYGVPELDYKTYEGNRIAYMLDDTILNIDAPHKGIYSHSVNKIPVYRGNYDQIYSLYEEKIIAYKSTIEQLDYKKSFALPFENTFQYLSESGYFDHNMPEYINIIVNPVLNNGIRIDDAINEYKRQFFIAGYDFKLTEFNRNINSEITFDYSRSD